MNWKGDYLRVLKPVTTDGSNLDLDENYTAKFKEIELPLSAKAALDEKNKTLPDQLKLRIEVVSNRPRIQPAPAPKAAPAAEPEFQDFDDTPPAPAKKAGRPPVNKTDDK